MTTTATTTPDGEDRPAWWHILSKPGRKPTLTDTLQEQICAAIAGGATQREAARSVGIHQDTITYWKRQGRTARDEGKNDRYARFLAAMEAAEAQLAVGCKLSIRRAALPRTVTKRTETLKLDRTGRPYNEIKVETYEEWDWRAAEAILNRLEAQRDRELDEESATTDDADALWQLLVNDPQTAGLARRLHDAAREVEGVHFEDPEPDAG